MFAVFEGKLCITVLAYTIRYSCCHFPNYYLSNFFFLLFVPFSKHFWGSFLGMPNTVRLLQRATPCVCGVHLSVHLGITLKGVQVGFVSQDAGVGEVGGSVEVEARQDLDVPHSRCVELQQVFDPLRLVLGALQRHRQNAVTLCA